MYPIWGLLEVYAGGGEGHANASSAGDSAQDDVTKLLGRSVRLDFSHRQRGPAGQPTREDRFWTMQNIHRPRLDFERT